MSRWFWSFLFAVAGSLSGSRGRDYHRDCHMATTETSHSFQNFNKLAYYGEVSLLAM